MTSTILRATLSARWRSRIERYCREHHGTLACYDARNGDRLWQIMYTERDGTHFRANLSKGMTIIPLSDVSDKRLEQFFITAREASMLTALTGGAR